MAIFAKKKDGRRTNGGKTGDARGDAKGDASSDGKAAPADVVTASQPTETGAVLTKANVPSEPTVAESEIRQAGSEATVSMKGDGVGAPAGAGTPDGGGAATTASADGRLPSASDPAAASAEAATAAAAAAAGDGDGIESVDIEPIDPDVMEAPLEEATPAFGIADAIRLMRSLPADPNIDLVVRVVRVTLGAVNVSVEEIMRDAEKKERKVRDSITLLEAEVAELEKRLHEKRTAIAAHQADLRETATVRARLHQADKYTPHPPPLPPGAARVPPPRPREWNPFDADIPLKDS